MDFVHDRTENGRTIRVLNVVDDYSRELIVCIPEHSFTGSRVTRELDQIMDAKAVKPRSITMDNGTEFTSRAFISWAYRKKYMLIISNLASQLKMLMLKVLMGNLEMNVLT